MAVAVRFLLIPAVALLAACADPPPPEFAVYTASFDKSREAARAIVGVFEPVERAIRAPSPEAFDPDTAAYLVEGAPVGASAQIIRGFDAVADYNEILSTYAAGASIDAIRPQLTELAANARLLALTVAGPAAGPAAGSAAGGVADAALQGVVAVGGALLAVSDRREFADVVTRRSGLIDRFLEEVRAATPVMYEIARARVNERKFALLTAGRDAEIAALDETLEQFRRALAVWVLTIDQTRGAVAALEDAVIRDLEAGLTLRAVAFWTGEIDRYAGQVAFIADRISGRL